MPREAAQYLPSRNPNGQFGAGNKLSHGMGGGEMSRRMNALKAVWLSAVSDADMKTLKDKLFDLACNATAEDVRLRSIMYIMDRLMGKPKESVAMEVSGDGTAPLNVNLSPQQLFTATQLVRQLHAREPVVDAPALSLPNDNG